MAFPGEYTIGAHFYGSHTTQLLAPVTITATIFTDYGRWNESHKELTLRLSDVKGLFTVGKVTLTGGGAAQGKPPVGPLPHVARRKVP